MLRVLLLLVAATSVCSLRRLLGNIRSHFLNALATEVQSDETKKLSKNVPLNVRIDDIWYDLRGWRSKHPSGEHWIDLYSERDATEVMHGFHSERARSMFLKMPKSKNSDELNNIATPVSQLTRNFRNLRNQLENDGWWKRDYLHEFRLIAIWSTLVATGIMTTTSMPALSIMALAIGNTAAGWIGHDYIHGVDKFSFAMRNFGSLTAGLSATWWSDKHNKHHAVTNEVGVDEDLATEPLLYVYSPAPEKDSILRKYQHIYFLLPLSMLFAIWRFDSLKLVLKDLKSGWKRKSQYELLSIAAHYSLAFKFIPAPIFFISTFVSGLITAIIVTVTHQSETFFDEHNPDFVDAQFRSTRDVECSNIFSDWLWGGMQYQLEHHLFPSMPRSKYPALSKVLKKFAADNNLEYRVSKELDIVKMNWETYRRISSTPSVPDRKYFSGKEVNWGGRGEIVPV